MKFDIINPSDPYTMIADDLEVAAVAICLLGNGKYALKGIGEDKENDVPVFFLNGPDEWFASKFGADYYIVAEKIIKTKPESLVSALNSITLEREERSSLNDIAGAAKILAESINKQIRSKNACE